MSAQPGTFFSLLTAGFTIAEYDRYIALIREALSLTHAERTPERDNRLVEICQQIAPLLEAMLADNAYIPEPHISGYSMPGGGRLMGKF
jgi:hypothetical protein